MVEGVSVPFTGISGYEVERATGVTGPLRPSASELELGSVGLTLELAGSGLSTWGTELKGLFDV